MKLSTSDCVKALKEKFGDSTYKRREKKVYPDLVYRIFEDIKRGNFYDVIEKNGIIDSLTASTHPAYMKKTIIENPVYYVFFKDDMGSIGLNVTDGNHFDAEGASSDWTPDAAFEELDKLGYPASEMMEGTLEFMEEIDDLNDLKAKLASSPVFKFSKKYQDFMLQFENEGMKIIKI